MPKRVIIIASGETERRALPHLLSHLLDEGITVADVRIPSRNRGLRVKVVEKIIKSAWRECRYTPTPPDKFVLLIDVDGKDPDATLAPFKDDLPGRLHPDIRPMLQYAYAQRHLEAWYFADSQNLRTYLRGKALGSVDTSKPDDIENPKQHLKNLLERSTYTARTSEDIARMLDACTIAQRSPSFNGFLSAVRNGRRSVDSDVE